MNHVVQGLWIGSELSRMEVLSIRSFLKNGHEYHLYVYDDVRNIPSGTVVKNGADILSPSLVFQYKEHKSYSGFSNLFRYKLLLEKGGWWVDSDLVCLKPFDFAADYVFSSEFSNGQHYINCGAIKAPAGSDLLNSVWETARAKDPEKLVWGEIGPKLLGQAVREFSLEEYVREPLAFCPIGYADWATILDPSARQEFGDATYAVHLWNEIWRRNGQDKNRIYPSDCLYEKLLRAFCGSEEELVSVNEVI